ncbi:phosphoribosylglycinamide formyltransferase [bacterium]|nr:phosphoribosylglycinamide formyltransferase [bacterium]
MSNIAVFASGSGSNAEQIVQFLKDSTIKVKLIVVNRAQCGAIERAKRLGVPVQIFSKEEFAAPKSIIEYLQALEVDFIVLAGFLLKIHPDLIKAFPDRIINLHPSLLPKYGGKGMYGKYVHEAVLANNETKSGITIHLVNEDYDDGRVLKQASVDLEEDETLDTLSAKVQRLEHQYFPNAIHDYITTFNS